MDPVGSAALMRRRVDVRSMEAEVVGDSVRQVEEGSVAENQKKPRSVSMNPKDGALLVKGAGIRGTESRPT